MNEERTEITTNGTHP